MLGLLGMYSNSPYEIFLQDDGILQVTWIMWHGVCCATTACFSIISSFFLITFLVFTLLVCCKYLINCGWQCGAVCTRPVLKQAPSTIPQYRGLCCHLVVTRRVRLPVELLPDMRRSWSWVGGSVMNKLPLLFRRSCRYQPTATGNGTPSSWDRGTPGELTVLQAQHQTPSPGRAERPLLIGSRVKATGMQVDLWHVTRLVGKVPPPDGAIPWGGQSQDGLRPWSWVGPAGCCLPTSR